MKVNGVGAAQEQINDIQQYGFGPTFTLWLLTMVGYGKVTGDDCEVKRRGLMDKVRGVRDGLSDDSDRIPPQHKDTAHNHPNRGKQFLAEMGIHRCSRRVR
jgi:hypothetical protein